MVMSFTSRVLQDGVTFLGVQMYVLQFYANLSVDTNLYNFSKLELRMFTFSPAAEKKSLLFQKLRNFGKVALLGKVTF